MKKEALHRQHDTTTIPELYGQQCGAWKAVMSAGVPDRYWLFFLQLAGVWHRFFLDAGLLFWQEGVDSCEDELLDGEGYFDLGEHLQVIGSSIERIEMDECQLTLEFANGACLRLKNEVLMDGSEVVEVRRKRE